MKVRDLEKLESVVYNILVDNERAREDDMYLYYAYCISKWYSVNDCPHFALFLVDVFENKVFRQKYKIASFTSVERARRKVQEKHPELKANVDARLAEKEQYLEYARS